MLTKGKGIPTTGIIPTTIERFIKTVDRNIRLNPPIVSLQKRSLALSARYKHLSKININTVRSRHTPINPNSSAITEKIKSVSVSGKKSK